MGGVDLLELVEEFGTPVFVYDVAHLRSRCREAVAGFGPGVAYATKAFLCKAMAALAIEEGMALDVSTGGELAVALAGGAEGGRLVLHGNNKSTEEIEAALRAGVGRIVIDSFDEIDRLRALGVSGALTARTSVLIRVTPGIEAHTHEYVRTGQEDTKFGFSLASGAAAQAVEAVKARAGPRACGRARSHRQPDLRCLRLRRGDRSSRTFRARARAWRNSASEAVSEWPTSRGRPRPR